MSVKKVISVEAYSDDGGSYPIVTFTENPQIEDGLPPSKTCLTSPGLSPLRWARMGQTCNLHDGREKPLWLSAHIRHYDLLAGEPASANRALAEKIRKRGIWRSTTAENDECGHIVGEQIGGKMNEFNLFPQSKSYKKGWKSNFVLWEFLNYLIKKWLTLIPEKFKPHVEYQMRLYYGDNERPDRPDSFKYSVEFFMSDEERDNMHTVRLIDATEMIFKISLRAVQTVSDVNIETVEKEIEDVIQGGRLGGASEFQDLKREIVDLLLAKPPPVSSKPTDRFLSLLGLPRDRTLSIVDFIPVVGSIKGMAEGCKNLSYGNYVSGGVNLALGAVGLVLDFMFLGGAGFWMDTWSISSMKIAGACYTVSCAIKCITFSVPIWKEYKF